MTNRFFVKANRMSCAQRMLSWGFRLHEGSLPGWELNLVRLSGGSTGQSVQRVSPVKSMKVVPTSNGAYFAGSYRCQRLRQAKVITKLPNEEHVRHELTHQQNITQLF
jgi:hypothetical protein